MRISCGATIHHLIFDTEATADMSREDAIDLALNIMNEVADGKINEKTVELALIELKNHEFRKLPSSEVKEYISKVKRKKPPAKGEE